MRIIGSADCPRCGCATRFDPATVTAATVIRCPACLAIVKKDARPWLARLLGNERA